MIGNRHYKSTPLNSGGRNSCDFADRLPLNWPSSSNSFSDTWGVFFVCLRWLQVSNANNPVRAIICTYHARSWH